MGLWVVEDSSEINSMLVRSGWGLHIPLLEGGSELVEGLRLALFTHLVDLHADGLVVGLRLHIADNAQCDRQFAGTRGSSAGTTMRRGMSPWL